VINQNRRRTTFGPMIKTRGYSVLQLTTLIVLKSCGRWFSNNCSVATQYAIWSQCCLRHQQIQWTLVQVSLTWPNLTYSVILPKRFAFRQNNGVFPMLHTVMRYYLHPFFETRSVSKMGETRRYWKCAPSSSDVYIRNASQIQDQVIRR
jgi:hypothetical protein